MRMHIRPTRAIGLLATLTIVLIAVSVTFLLWDMRKRELETARLDTIGFAHMIREETEHTFDRVDLVLRGVQERMQTAYGSRLDLDSVSVRLLMSARIFGIRQLGVLYLLDADGTLVNSSRDGDDLGRAACRRGVLQGFRQRPRRGAVRRQARARPRPGGWTLHVARSFTGTDGKFRGVAVATMNFSSWSRCTGR